MTIRDRIKELRRVPAKDLQPHESNWRKHPAFQRQAMQVVLDDIGWADAVLAYESNGSLKLIDGHLRKDIGADEQVPVLVLDVDDNEAKKILATHDPICEMAGRDQDELGKLFRDIETSNRALVGVLEKINPGAFVPLSAAEDDQLPDKPAARSRTGEVWKLGRHRVMAGDATNESHVQLLLGGDTPFSMVTDPPYGVNYDPKWRDEAAAKGQLQAAGRRTAEVHNDDRADWSQAFGLFKGDVLYAWSASGDLLIKSGLAIEASGFEIRAGLVWKKQHIPISRGHYSFQHEPCWYAVRKGANAKWCGRSVQSTVIDCALDPNVLGGHSTQKPVECMAVLIRNHGDQNDAVYDPFVGSGTTLIAAEKLGRTCFAMDISTEFVDVSIARWEQFTGNKAVKL